MIRAFGAAAGVAIHLAGVAAAERAPDPKVRGERVFLKCYSCHTLDPGAKNLPGPHLIGILGRGTATLPGFTFSEPMQRFATGNSRWTEVLLDRYIADPEGVVPGTSMAFPGIKDPTERKELLDYLRSSSQKPR